MYRACVDEAFAQSSLAPRRESQVCRAWMSSICAPGRERMHSPHLTREHDCLARHFTTFPIKTSLRLRSIAAIILSRSLPQLPQRPSCASSSAPGPSPTTLFWRAAFARDRVVLVLPSLHNLRPLLPGNRIEIGKIISTMSVSHNPLGSTGRVGSRGAHLCHCGP